MNSDNRKQIILELQKLAESVLKLKEEHRQKRPIVIEFSGSPKAGKTSCINSLELFLKRNGFSVQIVQERASVCPVTDKQSPMFNLWTACMSLSGLIGILEDKNNPVDVLILDRGIFDALCWFEWLVAGSKMEKEQRSIAESFLLMDELVKCIDIVFAFCVEPTISIEREYATLLTDKLGTIMNHKVLGEYLLAIDRTIKSKSPHFHNVFRIDTSQKNQDEVSKEVTEKTLETLKYLLMERIGYIPKSQEIVSLFSNNPTAEYSLFDRYSPEIKFDLRETVEEKLDAIQPLPIAVITNRSRDKVLAVKKNKNAVSDDSAERDKLLLYVGGHSRYEDSTEQLSNDFLAICRSALRREIKEEIGISIALNNITPFLIYTPSSTKSSRHMAVCFVAEIDDESVKLRLDSHELVQTKGKSKSGRFVSIADLEKNNEYEAWSLAILNHCFGIKIESTEQTSLFENA